VFDINAKLGPWPYRPVKGLSDLLNGMDALSIERAAVSSLSAVHYLNPQDGNNELAALLRPHADRLFMFAVVRPNFAGWREDLRRCVDDYGARGIVVYPNYHEYNLTDEATAPLMHEAGRLRLPVCVQSGLEDVRRQFRPYKTDDVPANDIGDLARAFPETTFIAFGLKYGQPEQMGEPLPDNLYFDTSNYESMGEMEAAVARFGAGKILFGTNFPLFNQQANVDKVRKADINENDHEMIEFRNAMRLLNSPIEGGCAIPPLRGDKGGCNASNAPQ
jgi:uncharacterized protein